ncbi:MAG: hypothetical protein EH225_06225 [Calditrichaeota bacterium]|nr:MAG: hypothetical protein EH225_06225 [Calditrichota bacterium]
MYNQQWGGLPDEDFLGRLAPEMADMRMRLYSTAHTSDQTAGMLDGEWSDKLGLKAGIPVAVGALDAHLGAVGAGVGENILVKIMGTSTCDIMVYPDRKNLQDIPGVAGIVEGSVLPGYIGIEAGQSAVGDIFHWWVSRVLQKGEEYHTVLSNKASKLSAGQTGLLALDWNNGNRNILTDPNLTGLIIGQTLLTEDYEIYRTLIEATAFGARRIIEQMENHGIVISKVINCGGIAEKNPLVMQIYADILNRPMEVTASPQTVALGAAIFGGLVAYKNDPGFQSVQDIQKRVCRIKEKTYLPQKEEHQIYHRIYKLYKDVHDSFGISGTRKELFPLMKELLEIKRSV